MKRSILSAFFLLLTLGSQGSWCAAHTSTKIHGAHHKPHIQVQELHVAEGKKLLEIQIPRKVGHEEGHTHTHTHHEGKHQRRLALAHKGGASMGGGPGGGTGTGGRSGGAADVRPHNAKNGAAVALPSPAMSILALVCTCGILLTAFSS